jgi:glutamate-1-semialdehyde 2,1-aminomutase
MELYHRAVRVTPGGSQTGSKAPGKAGPLGGYPLFLKEGRGARTRDVDGHDYIDLIAGLAAVGLGHNDFRVHQAVAQALADGSLLSLPTEREAQASEALCRMTGWATQARWVKTGSEATEAAVRIARAATGKNRILTVRSGYHAWHSWFQAVKPEHPGVPNLMSDLIVGMKYGDYDTVRLALDWTDNDIAAVILEPAPITGGGDSGWLKWLVETAHKANTLVIFDEIVWGLRLSKSGGTDYFDIQPDLATYGKALGNGIPVAAVVGGDDLMKHATLVSGTFGGDQLGLAAAIAVLDVYDKEPIIQTMWARGVDLKMRLNQLFPGAGGDIQFSCTGYSVHPVFNLRVKETDDYLAMSFFLQRLAEYGVLIHPAGGNIMAALTADDVLMVVEAVTRALDDISLARAKGPLTLAENSIPYQQAFSRAR